VQTFKAVREILTYWLLFKKFVTTSNRLFFYELFIFLTGKTDQHY